MKLYFLGKDDINDKNITKDYGPDTRWFALGTSEGEVKVLIKDYSIYCLLRGPLTAVEIEEDAAKVR